MTQDAIDIQAEKVEPAPAQPAQAQTQAVALRPQVGSVASLEQLESQLDEKLNLIRRVMHNNMKEGQDYGKIPGTGEKPSLLQPGAQKLLMLFNLREQVKKETLREYPNMHREYEVTVSVFPSGDRPENGWDGLGTCSTMESKYRYRKAERKCPACGGNYIITGKAEFGGGFICFKKKGGCGAKFGDDDKRITSQPGGSVEYENPPDYWNTVRKMAFKRALVAAAINATNTSELWTQDIEDMAGNAEASKQQGQASARQTAVPRSKPAPPSHGGTTESAAAPAAAAATSNAPAKVATEKTREWMVKELETFFGVQAMGTVEEYFQKAGILMPLEALEDTPFRFVPVNREQMGKLKGVIQAFLDGNDAVKPDYLNGDGEPTRKEVAKAKRAEKQATAAPAATQSTRESAPARQEDPEWWRDVIVPIPRRGMKRAVYMQNPETIGGLYDVRHEDEEARKRLFGFANNFEPKGWEKQDGTPMPPSEADKAFRVGLDAFVAWFEKNHPNEKP